ncbi:MAG: FGGY family carbohydrate kinase, partial [Eubacteriales bacterium]
MNTEQIRNAVLSGNTCMGMEFGSTRIKAVLIDGDHNVVASGSVTWENRLQNGVWTYDLADAVENMQKCYAALAHNVTKAYGVLLRKIGEIGISGMMHGLLATDEGGVLVAPFRTWRNTMTAEESAFLSGLFGYTVPQRWSAAHLYQLMKTEPENARRIRRMTTLAGYIHQRLTGRHVLGCCEAAGMFPLDGKTDTADAAPVYYPNMIAEMDRLAKEAGMPWKTLDILPGVLRAGENAGYLTKEGAALLDPTGTLEAGIPFCPPEGDGGTGMVCTGSLTPGDAAVSAGTSTFGLFVLDRPLAHANPEVETTVTPCGTPVAEIQSNNGTSELDAWVDIILSGMEAVGTVCEKEAVYQALL